MASVDSPLFDVTTLEQMYCESCQIHGVLPNSAILSGFFQAQVQKSCNQICSLDIFLDDFKDTDFPPLFDLFIAIETSEVQAVDIRNGSSCLLRGEHVLSLMHAVNQKLRVAVLRDSPFGKDFLRELSQKGSTCQVLNLRSSHIRQLNMVGEFRRIRILNLDFSISLTSFREDCFTCMPNLICLSMCETKIANLWTTVAALSKLSSLVELSFQKWVFYSASSTEKSDDETEFGQPNSLTEIEEQSFGMVAHGNANLGAEEVVANMYSYSNVNINQEVQSMSEDLSDDSDFDFSHHMEEFDFREPTSSAYSISNGQPHPHNESSLGESSVGSFMGDVTDFASTYVPCHASPICYEKHYREYTIASLPHLKVLDNLPIRKVERESAAVTFSDYFEYLPYNRKHKESIMNIFHKRELKASQRTKSQKHVHSYGNSQYSYTRSLCAAKVGSSAWPFLHPLSISGNDLGNANSSFRPRQFEYHPTISSLMVFGTVDGDVVVVNHENEKIVGHIPSLGAMNSVLGLCWLKKYPSKLIAGSDNGSLRLYDIENMPTIVTGVNPGSGSVTFDDFDQLTSVHVNSTDELFLASGYSKDVALYDLNHGRRIQVFTDMHRGHINVVKFSNHMPSIFATSSFDHDVKLWDLRQKPIRPCHTSSSSRGNVMVCFSPDDQYLLVSAVDNEVRQLLAVDGRLHLSFEIARIGSPQNYTRSYYLNGRDYIITGSCDEHVVRVCCAQTGRRLRDICLEGRGLGSSMYVQSLRGDPFRDFNLSILAAYMPPSSKSEIVKVNLLQSCDNANEQSYRRHSCLSRSMGG
ncbi:hypothetical protein K2173_024007 [Erythroxylum novogranatense]|uniref:U2A'/phosphoprotein 32 family A C-terminal domain-containing protein n=1 Tax=Erythroxylum novogranatense TaxID=1862640 RepID=A0AAV8TPW4_9ROSI|nr:hypothetical protein K2173_024007 [Erythroxylum novogranatense]